jgi:molecular chaperone GrpE
MSSDESGKPPGPSDDMAATRTETDDLEELRARLEHVEDQWRRATADLENLQSRFQRELFRGQAAERRRVLGPWLKTLDDLERVVRHAQPGESAVIEGLSAVVGGALADIAALGYLPFGEAGEPFDPQLHEAISTTPADELPPNTIVEVIKPGYGTAIDLIRPASVVVSKAPD